MRLSIIIPFYDEAPNVEPVVSEVRGSLPNAEIIAVDDGSRDGTFEALSQQKGIEVHRLPRHLGQSAAVYAGLRRATGDVCVILDGDGQSSVADIEGLLPHFPAYDFVNGVRVERRDSAARIVASRVANGIRNLFTRDGMHDTGCTPKALKRECVDHLVPFDGLHRFIPALLLAAGFKGLEVPVSHRERLHGRTKYTSASRALRGAWDLLGVSWLLRRRLDPREIEPEAPPTRD